MVDDDREPTIVENLGTRHLPHFAPHISALYLELGYFPIDGWTPDPFKSKVNLIPPSLISAVIKPMIFEIVKPFGLSYGPSYAHIIISEE